MSTSLASFSRSTFLFFSGMLHRWYVVSVAVIVGALGGFERLLGTTVLVPQWIALTVAGISLLLAAIWTYHDLRVASVVRGDARNHQEAVEKALVAAHLEGQLLLTEKNWGADGRWEVWQDNTAEYICEVLGPAQKERFLGRGKTNSSLPGLFQMHLDELLTIAHGLQAEQVRLGLPELGAAEDRRLVRSRFGLRRTDDSAD
jgi:hypothetical protein